MKKILLTLTLAAVVASVSAQDVSKYDLNQGTYDRVTERGPYLTNRLFDNVFLGVAGGVNFYMGECDSKGSFNGRLAPALDVSLGKWITPSVGVRLQYAGLQAKGYSGLQTPYTNSVRDDKGMYAKKFDVMNAHADFLWNLSNAIGGYKETRTWSFIPYVGAGVARSSRGSHENVQIAATGGLLNKIRLSNLVDLTLEARYMVVKPEFDKVVFDNKLETMASLTAGVSFKFGPARGFKRPLQPIPADYTPYINKISNLESNLNKSQQALADSKTQIDALNSQIEALKIVPVPTNNTIIIKEAASNAQAAMSIFFKMGSYAVTEKDMVNISNIADFIKQSPGKVFRVVGYADSATGTPAINDRISQRRAQSVADALVTRFGVKKSQLSVSSKGGVSHETDPELSRVVRIEQ